MVLDRLLVQIKLISFLCSGSVGNGESVLPVRAMGEFYQGLTAMRRKENPLSGVLRTAWEKGTLHTPTKNADCRATAAHVSIATAISKDELLKEISTGDADNGMLNRFLWACSRRSCILPEGGALFEVVRGDVWAELQGRFNRNTANLRGEEFIFVRDEEASDDWGWNSHPQDGAYAKLTEPRTGRWGSITARGHVQVMRIALILAVLDGERRYIRRVHLDAAREIWRYCDESARYIFGDKLDDPTTQTVLDALRANPAGMTRTSISADVFQRNVSSTVIAAALTWLSQQGLARCEWRGTIGRPMETWLAI
jgi:hypothetical protein